MGDNPAEHCFVLKDLFQMSFPKLFMIVLLRIYTARKSFDKICLKAVRDTLFSNMCSVEGEGRLTGGNIQQIEKVQTFSLARGLPEFPPLVWHPNLSIRKIEECLVYLLQWFEKSEWEHFFQSNKFTAWKVKDEKEVANSLMKFNLLKIIHPLQGKRHWRT